MARIRTIKPEFWTDGKVAKLSDHAALFFIAIWNFCDDYGYFEIDSILLQLRCRWPARTLQQLLWKVAGEGLVMCNKEAGVGLVVGWKHQKIDKKRPSKWNDSGIQWDERFNDDVRCRKKSRCIGKERKGKERIKEGLRSEKTSGITGDANPLVFQTWNAYSEGYKSKYKSDPVSNAKVMGQLKSLLKRIPSNDAPDVAKFYATHPGNFYNLKGHPIGLLLVDAEKLYTEWKTGVKITSISAKSNEKIEHVKDQIDRVMRGEL